ncbi:phosphatidylethanolamine N-methyltransferase isoform X1 [Polypterus senegalus]|nr:phosphatidylethanolamine N-methyltransferase isoform X1 [Polypterus senegalus]
MSSAFVVCQASSELDCCGGLNNVDYSKVDVSVMADALQYLDITETSFGISAFAVCFNPFFWNVVARWEHRTRRLSRLFGSPYMACYSLAFVIVLLNIFRSHSFAAAMRAQPRLPLLEIPELYWVGLLVLACGSLLVLSSFCALGFTGTFLGDYFGILMEEKVTSFPFSLMENPMYSGSTAIYLGLALMNASPAGMILTCLVAVAYKVAISFEGPFTEEVYRQKSE